MKPVIVSVMEPWSVRYPCLVGIQTILYDLRLRRCNVEALKVEAQVEPKLQVNSAIFGQIWRVCKNKITIGAERLGNQSSII